MISQKSTRFTESVIRGMTQFCIRHNAINLSQGTPGFEPPEEVKRAAIDAIQNGYNQYSITWGAPRFRQAIAHKMATFNGIPTEPDRNVTVTCGSTEGMMSTMLAIINPGDEIVIFEPFYENYGPDTIISGAKPVYVPLRETRTPEGDYQFAYDSDELRNAFSQNTKAIVLNTPNNPLGKVFSRDELQEIAALCCEFDCLAVTDEIYEHMIYDERPHVSIGALPEMRDRTITISGLSKTYSITGWRLGYVVAPEYLANAIRKMHDFLTVGAPHPLQEAGVAALQLDPAYYRQLVERYDHRRKLLLELLTEAGFRCYVPEGAYYIMTDISAFGFPSDTEFAHWLVKEIGVGGVPGSSFYSHPELGRTKLRFMFSKDEETLREAGARLMRIREKI
ncbi:MAG: aminotransferase class I/II-fold pyridoxal phosphate-dependent enzyme [Candidatus Poribacteria bacterium]|nr:aminotransferase class I/II-fold pyridoxal phosphate-dependent enzyme [Candidatus Poribacteria bacterium]